MPNVSEPSRPETDRHDPSGIAKLDPIHRKAVREQKLNSTETEGNGNQITYIYTSF